MLRFISDISNSQVIQKFFLSLHRNPHILYYHMVGYRKPDYYYKQPLSPDAFKFQIEWLIKNKFEFVTLSEINKNGANKKRVAVTTDDGFIENYTCIAPMLSEYKIPATFFLLNNCIDNKDLMWMNKLFVIENNIGIKNTKKRVYNILREKEILLTNKKKIGSVYSEIPMKFKDDLVNEVWTESKLPELSVFLDANKPYMSYAQINDLLAAGFNIGAHTFSHPKCSMLSFEELEYEIVGSINQLREKFGTPVDYFAYPFGVRPKKASEEEIFRLSGVKAFLGTKNSDSKLERNITWERDKMEQPKSQSLFWFSIVPVIRKFFFRPFRIYK